MSSIYNCTDCVLLGETAFVDADGVQVLSRRKLCPAHLYIADNLPSTPNPTPHLFTPIAAPLTIPQIPTHLTTTPPPPISQDDDDFLNLLTSQDDPFFMLSCEQDIDSPASPPKKTRRRNHRFSEDRAKYEEVRGRVESGENLTVALKNTSTRRSSFYERRFIVELLLTDPDRFASLYSSEKRTITQLNRACKEALLASPLKSMHATLKKDGVLLK